MTEPRPGCSHKARTAYVQHDTRKLGGVLTLDKLIQGLHTLGVESALVSQQLQRIAPKPVVNDVIALARDAFLRDDTVVTLEAPVQVRSFCIYLE